MRILNEIAKAINKTLIEVRNIFCMKLCSNTDSTCIELAVEPQIIHLAERLKSKFMRLLASYQKSDQMNKKD